MQGVPIPPPGKSVAEQVTDPTVVSHTLQNVEVNGKSVTVVSSVVVTNGNLKVAYDLLRDSVESVTLPTQATLADVLNLMNRVVAEVNRSGNINAKLAEL